MSTLRQFAGQTIVYGIANILPRVLNWLIQTTFLSYILGEKTHEFALLGELYGYTAVLLVIVSMKMETALFRFGADKQKIDFYFDRIMSYVLIAAGVLLLIGLLGQNYFAGLLGTIYKPYYIVWFAFILAFDCLSLIPLAKLRLQEKSIMFAAIKTANVLLTVGLILFFFLILPKLSSDVFAWIPQFEFEIDYFFLTNLIASASVFGYLMYYVGGFKFKIDVSVFKTLIKYTYPLIFVNVFTNFIAYNNVAIIKNFSPGTLIDNLADSGVFDGGRRIAALFVLFVGAYNFAAEPFFFNNRKEADKKSFYGAICSLFVIIGGCLILGLVSGLDVIKFLIDKNYWASLTIIPILLLAYLFMGINMNLSIWYKLSDQTLFGALIAFCGAIVLLLLSYYFIPIIGFEASAWANLAAYALMTLLTYSLGQKYFPISYPVQKILLTIVVICLSVLLIQYIRYTLEDNILKYCFYAGIFLLYMIYGWKIEEKEWRRIAHGA